MAKKKELALTSFLKMVNVTELNFCAYQLFEDYLAVVILFSGYAHKL